MCSPAQLRRGETPDVAWNICEVYGCSNPTCLPASTTTSWLRTVLIWPLQGVFCKLHIEDAEAAQGLLRGHTAINPQNPDADRAARFKCVGNAQPGQVRCSS